jgi:hypothetical protein
MENIRIHTILLPEDPHFQETIHDFACCFTPQELEKEPFLIEYMTEQLGRWGRWTLRGRAPALAFEAACKGAHKYLEKMGLQPTEATSKMDEALARALAGMIVNQVEPDAVCFF